MSDQITSIFDTVEQLEAAAKWDVNEIVTNLESFVRGLNGGVKKNQLLKFLEVITNIKTGKFKLFVSPGSGRFAESIDFQYTGPDNVPRTFQVVECCTLLGLLITESINYPILAFKDVENLNSTIDQKAKPYCSALLGMYANFVMKFCAHVSGDAKIFRVDHPDTICIQYFLKCGELTHIFLGSSYSGVSAQDIKAKEGQADFVEFQRAKTACKDCRKNTMTQVCPGILDVVAPRAVKGEKDKDYCTWGDCAETFPYQLLASTPEKQRWMIFGKAMFTNSASTSLAVTDKAVFKEPCLNCQTILTNLKADQNQFKLDVWGDGRPVLNLTWRPMTKQDYLNYKAEEAKKSQN